MSHHPRRMLAALLLVAAPVLTGGVGPRANFDSRILAAHNRERAAFGLDPMRWDDSLAADARVWASHLARTGRFEHSPDLPGAEIQGENIWGGTPGYYQPENMVGLWIAEKRQFKRGVFPNNSRSGRVEDVSHYTQLMWRESGEVGCALSGGRREEILVCRYRKPGNVLGQLPF